MENKPGVVLWLTGLPCSGKSSIAGELEKHFQNKNKGVQVLDGDLLRATISKDLGFSAADRYTQCERVAYIANMLAGHGVNVIVALVSPKQNMRSRAKQICNHKEVYIKCSVEECRRRDVKGMYKKAVNGEISQFTGINDVYEVPTNPDILVDSEQNTLTQCTSEIIKFVERG